MIEGSVYLHLLDIRKNRGGGFFLLIDPDKSAHNEYLALAEASADCGVDALLVGSSFMLNSNFSAIVKEIKERSSIPVIIFPGSYAQITPYADAILFSSLISGRNPNYLIEEQIKGAPIVKKSGIEPIPTGYMLIASGSLTSVQYISNTHPIPRDKADIACATALAAQYMGMKLIYLEAGSGAKETVPDSMIQNISSYIDIPVIAGGGIRSPRECLAKITAGASFVVVGTELERKNDYSLLKELTQAVHVKESVKA